MRLGYSGRSMPSALRIEEASNGQIDAVRSSDCDVNWGRRVAPGALNPDTTNAVNKRQMRELFVEQGVPAPQLFDPGAAHAFIADHPEWALIGRPDFHTRGRGFWLCRTTEDVERALAGTRRKMASTHFMEYIATTMAPKEFRVHVFLGDSIRISEKRHTEFHKWTSVRPDPDLPKRYIREAAKKAIEAIGVDFGVVDILTSQDQTEVWVLEVNVGPGLGGSTPRLWAQTLLDWERRRHAESDEG